MRYVIVIICAVVLSSCKDSFINHELKTEKIGPCAGQVNFSASITSNINGERFQFGACADDDFDGRSYSIKRDKDNIVVDFPHSAGKKQSYFNMILDIDAKPFYPKIIIDGNPIDMVHTTDVPK